MTMRPAPDQSGDKDNKDALELRTKSVGNIGFPNETSDPQSDATGETLYGHGENYQWLMGVLHRVHVPRKGWKVRYAPLDQQDRWGGSVVPAADIRFEDFQDGDNVYIEGEIIGDRASLYLSGARYRISKIRLVTAADARRVH